MKGVDVKTQYYSTPQAARVIGVTVSVLSRAVWDGRVRSPQKSPSGSYLWAPDDIERASWVLRRRSSGLVEKSDPQHIGELLPDLMDDIGQRGTGK